MRISGVRAGFSLMRRIVFFTLMILGWGFGDGRGGAGERGSSLGGSLGGGRGVEARESLAATGPRGASRMASRGVTRPDSRGSRRGERERG